MGQAANLLARQGVLGTSFGEPSWRQSMVRSKKTGFAIISGVIALPILVGSKTMQIYAKI